MSTFRCDRCGKLISDKRLGQLYYGIYNSALEMMEGDTHSAYTVCPECENAFFNWMEGGGYRP